MTNIRTSKFVDFRWSGLAVVAIVAVMALAGKSASSAAEAASGHPDLARAGSGEWISF
jgi:TRAP-type C4-dicarboxylate transport system permease large subunit